MQHPESMARREQFALSILSFQRCVTVVLAFCAGVG